MKKQFKRILSKRLLPFVLAFACVFTAISPLTTLAASGDKKTFYSIQGQLKHYLCWSGASGTSDLYGHHLGTTKTSTTEMLKIGKVAFCLQHDQSPPATTGTSYTSVGKPTKNEYLCVYYGYASDTFASKFSLNKNESYYATECAIWGIKGQLNKNASATVENQFKYIKAKSGVTNSANVLKAAKWLMQRVIDNPDGMTVPALTADTSDSKIAITTNNKNRIVSGNKMQIGSFTVNEDYSSLTLTSAPSGAKIVTSDSNSKKFWIQMSLSNYSTAANKGNLSFTVSATSTKRYIVAEKYQLSGKRFYR